MHQYHLYLGRVLSWESCDPHFLRWPTKWPLCDEILFMRWPVSLSDSSTSTFNFKNQTNLEEVMCFDMQKIVLKADCAGCSIPFADTSSMDECNTILSAYTKYRHLGYCCTHPSLCSLEENDSSLSTGVTGGGQ